jgi:hypothetical protein
VDNTDGYADSYISSEISAYQTHDTTNVTARKNSFVDGGPNRGFALIWSEGSSQIVSAITFNGNEFVNEKTSPWSPPGTATKQLWWKTKLIIRPVNLVLAPIQTPPKLETRCWIPLRIPRRWFLPAAVAIFLDAERSRRLTKISVARRKTHRATLRVSYALPTFRQRV